MTRIKAFARFLLYMYPKDHGRPHVHIEAPEGRASIALDTLEVIESSGRVSGRMVREALAYAEAHQGELLDLWKATRIK